VRDLNLELHAGQNRIETRRPHNNGIDQTRKDTASVMLGFMWFFQSSLSMPHIEGREVLYDKIHR